MLWRETRYLECHIVAQQGERPQAISQHCLYNMVVDQEQIQIAGHISSMFPMFPDGIKHDDSRRHPHTLAPLRNQSCKS